MREGEKKQSSRKVVRLFQKRWVFPTLYIVCAAVILTAALWYQAANSNPKEEAKNPSAPYSQNDNPTVPVANPTEVVKMPVAQTDAVEIKKKFYEDTASAQEQEEALVFYNNTYSPSTGIDIAAKDGKSFDAVAALSGTVVKAEKDALLGYVVTVDSGNGVTTFYQSLEEVAVEEGDSVEQGDVLGKAGMSEVNKEAGYHLHFEIRKDNVAVNPEKFFDKTAADVKVEAAATEPVKDEEQNSDPAEEPAKDEKKQEDNGSETGEGSSKENN